MLAFGFIITIILIKYKPMYKVSVSGKELGYIQDKEAFEEIVKESLIQEVQKNVDTIYMKTNPEYELKLIERTMEAKEDEIVKTVKDDVKIVYKYYDIAFNNEAMESVDTIEEAEELVNRIKEENQGKSLDLSILEKYTENEEEIKTHQLEFAKNELQMKVAQKLEEQVKQKA